MFGILNIVFAVLGLFGLIVSLLLFLPAAASTHNPVVQLIHDSPTYAAWMKVSMGLGVADVAAKLVAGIGLLRLQAWGRWLSIVVSIYALVMVVVAGVVNYFYLVQPLLAQAADKQGTEHMAAVGGAIGGIFGSCFGLIYPVLLLIFMFQPKVKAAFAPVTNVAQ